MKKRKLLVCALSLVLLVGVIVSAMTMSAFAARGTGGTIDTGTDWKETGLNLVQGKDYAYSFAVIGDTQNLNLYSDVRKGTSYLKGMYQWILDNQTSKNIQYVMGVGDITQSWNRDYGNEMYAEWINAAEALALLDGKIDYSLVRGNHDFSDANDGFNGVFGIGDKSANGVDNQYYENLLALSATNDAEGRPMAGFRIDGKIEETYRKVTMGNDKYIIVTLDWHPMSKETDCVKDTKDLCTDEEYCVVHYNTTSKTCANDSANCVKYIGCNHHNSYVNGKTFCSYELCTDSCTKHDTLGWLDKLLADNSDYTAIITMHSFIMRDGSTVDDIEDVFPYENSNGTRDVRWHEVSSTGGNVTPKQLWDEVLSNHANVKMLFCGHVDEDNIITTQLRGKNGNTVTCQLIDGQTIDSSVEPVGLVAMYYMSADGSVVNVEYISTVRAAAGKPAYLRDVNQFTLTLDYGDAWTATDYGYIPTEIYNEHVFHVMLDDDSDANTVNTLYGSYDTWEEALTAVNELKGISAAAARKAKTYNIVMSKDYTYSNEVTSSQLDHNQCCENPSKIVLDLNGKNFSLANGTTFLPMYNTKSSHRASFTVKNGTMVFNGSAQGIVTQHGHPSNAKGSVIDVNLIDLNVKYASGAKGDFVHPFSMSDASGTRSTVNLNVTNCNIDASEAGTVTLFNLSDKHNDNDVMLTVKGGSVIGSTTANTTFVKQNYPGDTVTFFPDANGNYTTFTYSDNTALGGVFFSETEDKYLEFAAATEKDGKFVYNLVSSTAILTKYGSIPAQYQDATDYPFLLFKNGTVIHGSADWNTLINTDIKGNKEYQSGCVLLLQRDYSTSEISKAPSYFAYIDDITFDLNGYTITRGSNHFIQLFGTEATAHKANITLMNGTVKSTTNTAPIVYNNNSNNTSGDVMNMVFNGVTFDFSSVPSGDQGVLVAFADGTAKGVDSTMTFNDCTFYRGASTRKTTLFDLIDYKDGMANNKTDVKVIVNGGKLVADTLSGLTFAEYSPERESGKGSPDTVTLGKGTDGKEFQIVVPSALDVSSVKFGLTAGNHVLVKSADEGTNTSYVLRNVTTAYGDIPAEYLDETQYPFLVFKDGKAIHAFTDWCTFIQGITATAGEVYKSGCTILLRRDYSTAEASGNPSNFAYISNITFDLGGFAFTRGSSRHMFQLVGKSGTYETQITVKNGTIKSTNGIPFSFNNSGNSGIDKFNVICQDVTFDVSGSNGIVVAYKDGTVGTENKVTLNNCTINRGSSTSAVTLFIMTESNGQNKVDIAVQINGGTLKADKIDKLTFASFSDERESGKGSPDSVSFGHDAFTVKVLKAYNPESIFAFLGEDYEFVKASEDDTHSYYTITAKASEVEPDVETAYGTIPADKADVTKYPLVLFEKTGDGYTVVDYYSDMAVAYTKIAGALGKDYVILVRADYTKNTGKYIENFTGSLTVDLDGHTLSINLGGNYLFDLGAAANSPKGTFTIKNGTVVKKGGRGIVCMNYNSNLKTDAEYTFNFTNVTFSSTDNTYNKNVIFTTWENGFDTATAKVVVNSTFEDCTFDYKNSISGAVMLDLGHSSGTKDRVQHNVVIKGGTIIANTAADINSNFAKLDGNTNGRADSLVFAANAKGEYTTLTLPTSVSASDVTSAWNTVDGAKCVFGNATEKNGTNSYKLGVNTEYGFIDAAYADVEKNPIVIFKADGTFVGSYTGISDAVTAAGLVSGGTGSAVGGADCVILVRMDMIFTNTGNVTGYKNNVVIDLGGFTLSSNSNGACLLTLTNTATTGEDKNYGTVTFKNGEICYTVGGTASSVIRANGAEGIYTINFENVTLSTTNTNQTSKIYFVISTSGTSKADQVINSTFTNCVFDYSKAQKIAYAFGSGGGAAINAVLVNCDIIAGNNNALAFVDAGNDKQALAYYTGNSINDTLTVVGNIELVLDNGVAAPTATYTVDGVECVFVKATANDTTTTYKLMPKVMVDYKIKTSVTLYSNFVYNIYIPVANVNGFTVNGMAMDYTTEVIDNVEYYVVKVDLAAGETLKDIALTVTLKSGDTTVDANWTLNVYNYTKAVLGGDYNETTKTLMKDMLVYASAAHTYFENTEAVAEKLAEIKTLLGDYNAALPTGEAKAPADKTYFTDVAVYLGEVPSFRFYLASGYTASDFTFKVGNRTVEAKASEDGKYVEIVMYAYMMLDDVTFTVKSNGETGTYNLYSYLDYAKNVVKDANLVAIVEALMKYSVSAKNYRNYVIGM